MAKLMRRRPLFSREEMQLTATQDLTFNFAAALPGRASSSHTRRAYFRWIDTFLVDLAGFKPTTGIDRETRMTMLPIRVLQDMLTAPQVRGWLGILVQRGHGKQGLDQARASVVTLADLMAEAEWLDDYAAAALARVRPPRAEEGQRPGRWLSIDQIKLLMAASREMATTEVQGIRNHLVVTTLCTMALRREELAVARWGDLSIQNNRMVLQVHGKGRKVAIVDVPRSVMRPLDSWRGHIMRSNHPAAKETPIARRIWKGGRVGRGGLSTDGIWWILDAAATYAGIGHVAPHDLRRSVAGALHEAGTPIDKISRLLRHSNVAVTERYLNRLPKANEGAILMSNILGLEDDEEWPGFD
jgi:integrase